MVGIIERHENPHLETITRIVLILVLIKKVLGRDNPKAEKQWLTTNGPAWVSPYLLKPCYSSVIGVAITFSFSKLFQIFVCIFQPFSSGAVASEQFAFSNTCKHKILFTNAIVRALSSIFSEHRNPFRFNPFPGMFDAKLSLEEVNTTPYLDNFAREHGSRVFENALYRLRTIQAPHGCICSVKWLDVSQRS
jgi:hypothetical protein